MPKHAQQLAVYHVVLAKLLFSVTMNSIFIKLTGNKNRHEMLDGFKFRPDLTMQSLWSYMPLSGEKNDVSNFSQSPLMRYLSNLQVTRTGIKARNEFEFGPDRIIHFGVIRP